MTAAEVSVVTPSSRAEPVFIKPTLLRRSPRPSHPTHEPRLCVLSSIFPPVRTGDPHCVPLRVAASRSMFSGLLRAVDTNKVKPVIDRVFGFNEAREALKYMESGAHFGKIVVTI